ncbi:MAG TPA: hypothetical protein K8W02_08775 [Mediterranea massiliensis]|uniref:Uncharacterized protein n=1 Tax=Mediterranea massiliensis TaxID=1841865 RepID=A0A921HX12_9BACT|nr:hypothetical protein [Mediterranea massiliensis]HJF92461.1 hypothetical protein [Mediterranea massiliensis]
MVSFVLSIIPPFFLKHTHSKNRKKYSKNKNNVFRLFTSHAGKRIAFPPAASGEASPRQPEEGELEA